jgi:hypothetical protein
MTGTTEHTRRSRIEHVARSGHHLYKLTSIMVPLALAPCDWEIERYTNTVKTLHSDSQNHFCLRDAHGFITERLVLKQTGYNCAMRRFIMYRPILL